MFNDRTSSYLAEYYWPGVSKQALAETVARADAAACQLRRQGRDVALHGTLFLPSDETVFCLFDGRESDIRAAGELAAIPFERILETLWIKPRVRTGTERR